MGACNTQTQTNVLGCKHVLRHAGVDRNPGLPRSLALLCGPRGNCACNQMRQQWPMCGVAPVHISYGEGSDMDPCFSEDRFLHGCVASRSAHNGIHSNANQKNRVVCTMPRPSPNRTAAQMHGEMHLTPGFIKSYQGNR